MKKQGSRDRMDESRAMKDYNSGYEKGANSRYGKLPQQDFGHASKVYHMEPIDYAGCGKVEYIKMNDKGYNQEAWDYQW